MMKKIIGSIVWFIILMEIVSFTCTIITYVTCFEFFSVYLIAKRSFSVLHYEYPIIFYSYFIILGFLSLCLGFYGKTNIKFKKCNKEKIKTDNDKNESKPNKSLDQW